MVTLAQALEESKGYGGRRLLVDNIIDALDPKDAAALVEALHGPMSAAKIVRALHAVGQQCGESSVNTWRERNGAR